VNSLGDRLLHVGEAGARGGRSGLVKLFQDARPEEIERALRSAGPKISADALGWLVLPALGEVISTKGRVDRNVLAALEALVEDPGLNAKLRMVLIDFVSGLPLSRTQLTDYRQLLRGITEDARQPSQLRALTTGSAIEKFDAATIKLLQRFLDNKDPWLSDAACRVLTNAVRAGTKVPKQLAKTCAQVARRDQKDALRRPAILAALAHLDTDETNASLRQLVRSATTPDHRARLIAAAGERIAIELLAELIREAMQSRSAHEKGALRGLLAEREAMLATLFDHGFRREFLFLFELVPASISDVDRRRLLTLTSDPNSELAKEARAAVNNLPPDRSLTALHERVSLPGIIGGVPKEQFLSALKDASAHRMRALKSRNGDWEGVPREQRPRPGPVPSPPPPQRGFSTGFHAGDALYRDLILPGDHWHAGIYLGFNGDAAGLGEMRAINASTWPGDAITIASAKRSFASPTTDVAATMAGLKGDFLQAFREGHSDKKVYDARTLAGLTIRQRESVLATANSFLHKDIWWTWYDMMRPSVLAFPKRWDGTLKSVGASRCDGLVEWSYEFNELRVCSGSQPDLWKIAQRGMKHVDNHNHFHWPGINKHGQLCPRIQAGDQGDHSHRGPSDTTFVIEQPAVPKIADFAANGFAFFFVPSVFFRIQAPAYHTIYARLTVSKDNGRPHFVRTEDPYNNSGALVGDWVFKSVPANRADKLFAWWLGKTVDGTDFAGKNGAFTFHLVAIDAGGNVSTISTAIAVIDWTAATSAKPQPVAKTSGADRPPRLRELVRAGEP